LRHFEHRHERYLFILRIFHGKVSLLLYFWILQKEFFAIFLLVKKIILMGKKILPWERVKNFPKQSLYTRIREEGFFDGRS